MGMRHHCTACTRPMAPGQSSVLLVCEVEGFELHGYAHEHCAIAYLAHVAEQGQGREAAKRTLDAAYLDGHPDR